MEISTLEWTITIGVTVAVLPSTSSSSRATRTSRPCGSARSRSACTSVPRSRSAPGSGSRHGHDYGVQFYAGWLTEYSLSIDNLFVFIILMAALKVPREYQQEALMVGIVLALIFRGIFIALGYQLIENFSWVFYVVRRLPGLHGRLAWSRATAATRTSTPRTTGSCGSRSRHLNVGEEYRGLKLWYRVNGARVVSPMLIVIIALGTTDLLFALDSIPAIFGITQEPYLVFTANVFALMGLRQLYFLLGGLLKRLVYLSLGLAFILAFIGVKLVLHALHENELPFINGGEPVDVPDISALASLGVIIVTLAVTAAPSLFAASRMTEEEIEDRTSSLRAPEE